MCAAANANTRDPFWGKKELALSVEEGKFEGRMVEEALRHARKRTDHVEQ
jgi:hypothetical protein